MLSLRNTILATPIKKNCFAAVVGGVLLFGNVKFHCGVLHFIESELFSISYWKLNEFTDCMTTLAKNIVEENDPFETFKMEISDNDNIQVNEKAIILFSRTEERYRIEFDHFTFIDFATAIGDVCDFITNPSSIQFVTMQTFVKKQFNQPDSEKNIEEILDSRTPPLTEDEKLLLAQYLRNNAELSKFLRTVKMIGNKSL